MKGSIFFFHIYSDLETTKNQIPGQAFPDCVGILILLCNDCAWAPNGSQWLAMGVGKGQTIQNQGKYSHQTVFQTQDTKTKWQ